MGSIPKWEDLALPRGEPVASPSSERIDPRYAPTEPPHWGQPPEERWHSAEVLYPRGFYGQIRSAGDTAGR